MLNIDYTSKGYYKMYSHISKCVSVDISIGFIRKCLPCKYYWNESGALGDTSTMTDAICSSENIVVTAGDLLHWRPTGVHNQGWMN